MPIAWRECEGVALDGELRLGEYLGGSEHGGVFLISYGREGRKAAAKLTAVGGWGQGEIEAELGRLQKARKLTHPNLLKILQIGRARVAGEEVIFVVMEHAEEDLSQILPQRPLSAEEVREVLQPTLDVLSYLHANGFVHGRLKPSNVLAVGNQLKLSSDGIRTQGEIPANERERGEYDAPEIALGEKTAASDLWSLGALLVMMLTQHLPCWDESSEDPTLPDQVPAPFDELTRNCLRRDPAARSSLARLAEMAGLPQPAKPALIRNPEVQEASAGSRGPGALHVAPPMAKTGSGRQLSNGRKSNALAYIAAAVALVIAAAIGGPRLFRSGAGKSAAGNSARDSRTDASQSGSAAQRQGRKPATTAEAKRKSARTSGDPVSSTPIAQRSDDNAGKLSVASERIGERGLSAGRVAKQILPDVPKSASNTIHGTVRVGVRVNVDSSGNVTGAELDSAGPSKYFAQVALDAAQQWKFEPPKMQGRNVLSDWLLSFQFTNQGTKVIPAQIDP